ncbi:MAG TPA: AAA family ATPase [Polyangiaceae bacterium]|nr:AAA family ATPase [Polyangiaceae bacterium]
MSESALPFTFFLLSPANLAGERAALVFNPHATFELARQLHAPEGAPLGELYSFVSGLYFRGKMVYAQAFGKAPAGLSGALVMSPSEGLRFLHERLTLERLRSWADVDIHEQNRRFTEPLLAHALALERAYGQSARFVLLGSVATDKYVQPLTQVFGDRLLFPREFVGRGDMSRGSLLLRAARAGTELEYAPVSSTARQGSRPPALRRGATPSESSARPRLEPSVEGERFELVLMVGLPGAGKSSFVRERFATTHTLVSKDELRNSSAPARRHRELLEQALSERRSVVVDDTNVTVKARAGLIALGMRHGARVIGYFLEASARDCAARNRQREGRARIPDAGIFAAARQLVVPQWTEGFDELYTVQTLGAGEFEVLEAERDGSA